MMLVFVLEAVSCISSSNYPQQLFALGVPPASLVDRMPRTTPDGRDCCCVVFGREDPPFWSGKTLLQTASKDSNIPVDRSALTSKNIPPRCCANPRARSGWTTTLAGSPSTKSILLPINTTQQSGELYQEKGKGNQRNQRKVNKVGGGALRPWQLLLTGCSGFKFEWKQSKQETINRKE